MIKIKLLIALMLLSVIARGAQISKQEIESTKGYNYLKLPVDVYSSGLDTVRIVDEKGEEVPYILNGIKREKTLEKRRYSGRLIESYIEDDDEFFIFKVLSSAENPEADVRVNLLVLTPDRDRFAKDIQILGGYDQVTWDEIGEGTIYSVDGNKSLTFKIRPSRYTYYKIRVYKNKGEIGLKNLEGYFVRIHELRESLTETLPLSYTRTEEEGKTKITIEGVEKKPLEEIIIKAQGNYNRSVAIGRRKQDIFKYDFSSVNIEKNTLSVGPQGEKELTLYIENHDDSPLNIKKIRGVFRSDLLIFKGQAEKKYFLVYGDTSLSRPNYDMVKYKDLILEEDYTQVSLVGSVEKESKETEDETLIKRNKLWFDISVSIVALILIFLGLRAMRNRKDE